MQSWVLHEELTKMPSHIMYVGEGAFSMFRELLQRENPSRRVGMVGGCQCV